MLIFARLLSQHAIRVVNYLVVLSSQINIVVRGERETATQGERSQGFPRLYISITGACNLLQKQLHAIHLLPSFFDSCDDFSSFFYCFASGAQHILYFIYHYFVEIFLKMYISTFQLLGELLLDRHNFSVMTKYISNPDNLKLMMNLLKDKSRNIQFEAFHVFKVSLLDLDLFYDWREQWKYVL